jgi:hypothetical protein
MTVLSKFQLGAADIWFISNSWYCIGTYNKSANLENNKKHKKGIKKIVKKCSNDGGQVFLKL